MIKESQPTTGFQNVSQNPLNQMSSSGQCVKQNVQQQFGNSNNIFKGYKQMTGCQTSTSINIPRGSNPKRTFGRDLPITTQQQPTIRESLPKDG